MARTATAPKTLRTRIQEGELAAYWSSRELTQRFAHKRSDFYTNEQGMRVERLAERDSAYFEPDRSIGPGYWFVTSDPEEIASLDAAAERSNGPTRFHRVRDLLNWTPPVQPIERRRAVNPL